MFCLQNPISDLAYKELLLDGERYFYTVELSDYDRVAIKRCYSWGEVCDFIETTKADFERDGSCIAEFSIKSDTEMEE